MIKGNALNPSNSSSDAIPLVKSVDSEDAALMDDIRQTAARYYSDSSDSADENDYNKSMRL